MTRIAWIEPIAIACPDPNDCGTIRRTVLVRVETTDGVVGWDEAITGFRGVDALCTKYGKKINAHAWSTGIMTPASVHCSLASPDPIIFEFKPFAVVVQDVIVAEKLWHSDGSADPIHGPGLGIAVIDAKVRKLAA